MTESSYGAIFDMDGVLVDSTEAHYRGWCLLGEELGVSFAREFFDETFGMRNYEIIPMWLGDRVSQENLEALSVRKEELYRDVAASILEPLDGVPELLHSLISGGFRLAIGSSGPKPNVEMVLEILDAWDQFAAMSTLEDVSKGKPDPQVFEVAARKLELPPARCVVVEDAPQGVEAGVAAGAKVLAVTSTRPAEALSQAHVVVDSLTEIDAARLRELVDG